MKLKMDANYMSNVSTNYLVGIGSALCGAVAYTVTGSPRLGGGIAFLIWTVAERYLFREGPIQTLPPELIGRIASFLPPNDLVHSLQVNSQWNSFIANDLACKISMMLAEAKTIALQEQDSSKRDELLLEIVGLEALFDLPGAKATAKQISSNNIKDKAFLEIIKVEVQHDLPGAQETVYQMRYRNTADQAFLEIVREKVLHDLAGAEAIANQMRWYKDDALLEIVKAKVQHDLAGAKITAEQIQDPGIKDQAFLEIVKVEAKRNPRLATVTAKHKIQDSYQRVLALIEIAEIDSQHNFAAAKDAVEQIRNLYDKRQELYDKKRALIELVKKATVELIQHRSDKVLAHIEIAKIDPQHNFDDAKAMANKEAEYLFMKDEMLLWILKAEMQYNLPRAKTSLKEFQSLDCQVEAHIEIAKVDPQHDLSPAKVIAEQIENPFTRFRLLAAVGELDPRFAKYANELEQLNIAVREFRLPSDEPVPAKDMRKERFQHLLKTVKAGLKS